MFAFSNPYLTTKTFFVWFFWWRTVIGKSGFLRIRNAKTLTLFCFLRGGRGSGFLPRFSSRFFFMSFPPPPFLERSIQYCDSGFHHIFFCPLVLEETNQTVVRSSPPFNRERINNKTPKKIKVLFSCSPWFLTNPPLKNPTHTGAMSALFFACFVFFAYYSFGRKKNKHVRSSLETFTRETRTHGVGSISHLMQIVWHMFFCWQSQPPYKTPFISRLVLDSMLFLNDNAQNKKLNHNKIALHLNHFEK